MKTWITYLAAILMGIATCLIFSDYTAVTAVYSSVTGFLVSLGIFLFIPITIITFTAGIASLRKDKLLAKSTGITVLWSLLTTAILALSAAAIFLAFPVKFPVSSSAGSDASVFESIFRTTSNRALNQIYPSNPFMSIATTTYYIVPILIISWILGISLKPNADIIRPAYTVMNSFAEVMYRIVRTITVYGFFLAYTASSYFFLALFQEKTVLVSHEFMKFFLSGTIIALLIILPLIYAIFTRFRKNPYWALGRSFTPIATGLFTGNILMSAIINEGSSRQNVGVQKRIVSTATPIFTIIGRGGTAFITTLTVLSLFNAVGAQLSTSSAIVASLMIALASFISCIATGYEIIVVLFASLKLMNLNLYGAEATILAMLPLLTGLSVLLDSAIAALGNAAISFYTRTDVKIPYRDIL